MLQNGACMTLTRVPTILVVDDTDVVRKSAARCLRRRGYLVLEASSAAEALAVITANSDQLDLLLTDLVLPASSGVELIAEVRRRFPAIGVAGMTGHFGASARCEQSFGAGARVLIKPFTPNLLAERVREALLQSGWSAPIDSSLELIGPNDSGGCGTH
jgi:two-component system cell cycle sensor histidine kinase/response regulator CckA